MSHINLLRKIQFYFSVIIFISVFIFCYKTTGFDLTMIPLSKWGITYGTAWIWNFSLILMGVSCYINVSQYLKLHPHLEFKKEFKYVFIFQSLSICMIGIFPSGNPIHGVFAYTYFFTLPLTIFSLATFNRKRISFQDWVIHISLSSLMIFIPLVTFIYFTGHAIAETIHTSLFLLWNLYLHFENK